ncbi:MAG: triose-phosphate isomerase [Alphaproteobacteria bacterium]|nr:triose-phosphate isomerase [Alphaproteobacteria bacterium]
MANWKMNGRLTSGLNLAQEVAARAMEERPLPFDVVLCPPTTLLWPVAETLMGSGVMLGGQDCHYANHGAYTGDISAGMLVDLSCRYVILGHSERRMAYGEDNALIAKKVAAAQLAGLVTVVCVGETLDQRAAGGAEAAIVTQLLESLPDRYHPAQLIVAYEPIWAIGSGQTPEVEEISAVHRKLREALGEAGVAVPIIYGGSVAIGNAGLIMKDPDVDGVLVGAASLSADGFWAIAEKAQ